MKKTLLLIALLAFTFGAFAQTKTEITTKVKVDNTDGKYHIKIDKVVDGKTTTIDKTYNSMEEMKNDPELEGINLHFFEGKSDDMVFFSKDGEVGDHKVKMIIEMDGDSDMDFSKGSSHSYIFKSDATEGDELHDFKVWIDEDGEKHITKNGEEIELEDGNTWADKDGNQFTIKKSDGKVMILSDDGTTEFKTSDGETFDFHFSTDDAEEGEHRVRIFKSGDSGDKQKITVKVIEHIKIHLKDIEENDFSSFDGIDAKSLKMDELNYYPNPNEGKFTLQFKTDKRPTEVKITSLEGKTVYSESLQGFEGSYQNEIDLSSQKKGIYLLQIIQGNRATNKKIVIE